MKKLTCINPLISVVLPVYNGAQFLSESIQSVVNQTYQNWELIIVDDCSTDHTPSIIQEYTVKDKRITHFRNAKNLKLPASLNAGFKKAKGEFYTWTSDDNYYYPTAFEKMMAHLDTNPQDGMVYAVCKAFNTKLNTHEIWCDFACTPEKLLDICVPGACFLYRKSIADEIGGYDTNSCLAEDHDYWLRMLLKAPIGNVEEELYLYRIHDTSLTAKYGKEAKLLNVDLAIKYADQYLQKFPEIEKYINENIGIRKAIRQKNDVLFRVLKSRMPKNAIYKELKYLLSIDRDNGLYILKKIAGLNGKYIIKALLRYLKYFMKEKI